MPFSISRKQIFSKILSQILLFKLLYFTFGREILGENPLERQSENCEVHRRKLAAKPKKTQLLDWLSANKWAFLFSIVNLS